MDIFRFTNTLFPTLMLGGEIINDINSKTWIERYRDPGEFTLIGNAASGLKEKLPRGSFISHTNSQEIMIVEDHQIVEDSGSEPKITITGRSFETFLDHRIVGSNVAYPTTGGWSEYVIPAAKTWEQAAYLLIQHINWLYLVDDRDALGGFEVHMNASGDSTIEERSIKYGGLHAALIDILKVDNLGIKVVRPGPWGSTTNPAFSDIIIHRGVDRSNTIIFAYDQGEVESGEYLWSNRQYKNCAFVMGKFVTTLVDTSKVGYDRRMMLVDASDLDDYQWPPIGTIREEIVAKMQVRGQEALAAQNQVALARVDLTKDVQRATYRKDYDLGDIISVRGNYNESSKMRVTEYVETEDETGSSSYPTLTSLDEEKDAL